MNDPSTTRRFFKATEEILLLLEKSKSRNERAIDLLPGIFLIIDDNGKIIRSNHNFTKLFSFQSEANLNTLVSQPMKADLNSQLQKLRLAPGSDLEIELELGPEKIPYAISISSWVHYSPTRGDVPFFTLVGKDLRTLKNALKEKDRLRQEVNAAEQLQKLMMPLDRVENSQYDLVGYFRSAAECGGDFLHYKSRENGLTVWAGDVTGHGLGPAMITGAVKSAISMQDQLAQTDARQALATLHSSVKSVAQGLYWMTFQLMDFNFQTMTLKIAMAAHTPVYCLNDMTHLDQKTWKDFIPFDEGPSHPLGVQDSPKFDHFEQKIKPGNLYLSFSDGLYEHINAKGSQFGLRRLFNSILDHLKKSNDLALVRDGLIQDFNQFTQGESLQDDISFWALRVK
jgi:serine phosphatase RsbU (regulator of sigma subunit)